VIEIIDYIKHSPFKLYISIFAILLAIITLILLRKTQKTKLRILLIYLHISLLILPIFMFAFSLGCDMSLLDGLISNCAAKVTETAIYIGIGIIILTLITGYFLMPKLFGARKKIKFEDKNLIKFVEENSRNIGIKAPKLYLIDDAKPDAFSYSTLGSSIFISVGMIELLNRKELEAVLLHELYHIKNRSSLYKFSNLALKILSPLPRFIRHNMDLDKEELEADNFAINEQGTSRNIINAKKKMGLFLDMV